MILSRYLYDSHWDFNIWFAIKGRLELVYLRVVTMAARGHQSWMEFRVSCQPNIIHFMLYNNVFIPKDESTRKLENNAGLKHTYIYKNSKRKPLFFFFILKIQTKWHNSMIFTFETRSRLLSRNERRFIAMITNDVYAK